MQNCSSWQPDGLPRPAWLVRHAVVLKYRTPNKSRKRSSGPSSIKGANSRMGAGDSIVKRMTIPAVSILSSAGGVIPVTSVSSAAVESTPASEWASFAARYQQYRIRKITAVLYPCRTIQDSVADLTELDFADYIGSASPSSAAAVLSDENSKSFSSGKPIVYRTTWSRNPNAKLWNPTSAAIPTANTFSIAFCSNSSAELGNATLIMQGHYEFEVELRGSQ